MAPPASFAEPKEPRFRAWAASLVFTCICLAAHASRLPSPKSRPDKWVLSALCLNLIFAFCGVVGHFVLRDKFVGQLVEGGVAALMAGFWIFSLPAIMDPDNDIAMTGQLIAPVVINSNLYFFSWISFGISLVIGGTFAQEKTDTSFVNNIAPKTAKWAGLFACSIILISSASKFHKDASCSRRFKGQVFCRRGDYAISMGVMGLLASMAIIFMTVKGIKILTPVIEFGVSTVMFIFYIFGIAFLTFGNGPATSISNLYFATWVGFFLTFFLSGTCLSEVMAARLEAVPAKNNTDESTPAPAPKIEDLEATAPTEAQPAPEAALDIGQ